MGEKVYRPIMKDGDHLAKSKTNPDRVRGLSFDSNNKNPDIIEWEEIDVDDLGNASNNTAVYNKTQGQLTQEEDQMAQAFGVAIADLILAGSEALFKNVISPWWQKKVQPRLEKKGEKWKKTPTIVRPSNSNCPPSKSVTAYYNELSTRIDSAFENLYSDIIPDEAGNHILNLIYHMLGMTNEIRIIANSKIEKESQNVNQCIEQQIAVEKFLVQKVTNGINSFLIYYNLQLDPDTSRKLYYLTGGGIRINGTYMPVNPDKICQALKAY